MDKQKNEQPSHASLYLRQNELTQKSVELKVLHDHLKVNKELCEEKKLSLEKEIKLLDEIHSKVWQLQDKICNQVWDFSMKHDINDVVRNYPDLPSEFNVFCECEDDYSDATYAENIEIERLTLEIRSLESNLKGTKCESLEKELILTEKGLQKCEKESPENERLKTEIRACEERIGSLRSKTGTEHKRIESSTNISLQFLKNTSNSIKTNPSNLKKTNTFVKKAPLLSAPQANLDTLKETSRLSKSSILDRGGFVRASTYFNTIENPIPLQNTSSDKQIVTETVPTDNLSTFMNPPRKKFVPKTKSGITQRR